MSQSWKEYQKAVPHPRPLVTLPDHGEWGPAMRALGSDRQRAFVFAYVMGGGRNYRAAYIEAGYTAANNNVVGVEAYKLAHDDRILAAIREESAKRLGRAGAAAADFLARIVEDEDMKKTLRLKASLEVLNRIGIHAMTEHKVTVEKRMNPQEKIEHAMALAKALGLDPKKLLGQAGVSLPSPGRVEGSDMSEITEAEIVPDVDPSLFEALP